MADIENVRTLEDVISVLRKLYFNMDNLSKIYYDMFINPEPMTVNLERYDETGELETISLKNRAAELVQTLSGYGSPEGSVAANPGVLYIDLANNSLYYKTQDSSDAGWVQIYSYNNPLNYLSPTSSAPNLTDLNASNIHSGILSPLFGGSGVAGNLLGILKANGENAYTVAQEGVDYLVPDNLVGMISYFSKNDNRSDWLVCNGGTFSAAQYPKLYNFLGSTTLPDLRDRFIRSWDGTKEIGLKVADSFKAHTHTTTKTNTGGNGKHTHTGNTLEAHGTFSLQVPNDEISASGVFTKKNRSDGQAANGDDSDGANITLSTSGKWTGNTSEAPDHTHTIPALTTSSSGGTETAPKHIVLVAKIYAGPKVTV